MEQGKRILPLSAEKKPGANGIPVLLEKSVLLLPQPPMRGSSGKARSGIRQSPS